MSKYQVGDRVSVASAYSENIFIHPGDLGSIVDVSEIEGASPIYGVVMEIDRSPSPGSAFAFKEEQLMGVPARKGPSTEERLAALEAVASRVEALEAAVADLQQKVG